MSTERTIAAHGGGGLTNSMRMGCIHARRMLSGILDTRGNKSVCTAGTVESSDRAQMGLERTKIKIHVAIGWSYNAFIARNCRVLVRQSWKVIGHHPEPLRPSYRPLSGLECILSVLEVKLGEKEMRNMRTEQARSGEMLGETTAERASMALDDQGGRRPTRIT
ncbi:hypothetical protein B0H13DRAFT_2038810 [Mycena leptocephala]|nr:hypothetical protein B0H13DRAFT_2038810 [Mycena leptocephala]